MKDLKDIFPEPDSDAVYPVKDWKVLVVDDDEDMHEVTQFVLDDISYEGRPLTMLSAFSASQAKNILQEHDDIAVILLDVVM